MRALRGALFDYIVAGGGTAGCLVASRLAQQQQRVLLLEAGARNQFYPWLHIPIGYLYCIGNPRTDWLLATEPEAALGGRRLAYPRGKTLGGTSAINGMVYIRGQAEDFNHWARVTEDSSWRWSNVLPLFKAHESHHSLDENAREEDTSLDTDAGASQTALYHGSDGAWRVERQRLRWPILETVAEAAQQAGIPFTQDFNRGDNEGVGTFEVTQRRGRRLHTAQAFLRNGDGVTVWTKAHIHGLELCRNASGAWGCEGVRVQVGQQRTELVRASKGVVLCSGSIGSPQLLQVSGIGPAMLLERHAVQVKIDSPGVGSNLQDHLQLRPVFKVAGAGTLNTLAAGWLGRARIAAEYACFRSGPMSMAPSQLCAFTRSSIDHDRPNLQLHIQPLSLEAFGQPLHPFDAVTMSVCNLRPSSRGHVSIASANARVPPKIAMNYLSTAEDRQVAHESMAVVRHIMRQPALAMHAPIEHLPDTVADTAEEQLAQLGRIATTIFHPVGTVKMGHPSDPMAVLNSRLQVLDGSGRTVQGLHVADASIMPTITSGNTNSPTLMIAEKAAAMILAEQA